MKRTKLGALLAGILLGICPMLMAPTGGIPSRPSFQTVTIRGPVPQFRLYETDAPADEKAWRLVTVGGDLFCGTMNDAYGGGANWCQVTRTGTTVDGITFSASSIALNSSSLALPAATTINAQSVCLSDGTNCPVAAQTSGNFTVSLDNACTTTPTVTFGYVKLGDTVTVAAKSSTGLGCTGDSTEFAATSTASVPAALRPTIAAGMVSAAIPGFQNNGANTGAYVRFRATGEVDFIRVDGNLGTVPWTAAGSRNLPLTWTFTYYVNNP